MISIGYVALGTYYDYYYYYPGVLYLCQVSASHSRIGNPMVSSNEMQRPGAPFTNMD